MGWLPDPLTTPKRLVTAYQTTSSLFGHLLVYEPRWNPAPVADLAVAGPCADHGDAAADAGGLGLPGAARLAAGAARWR